MRTVQERCRVCYTCVRECPAKAIRIAEGQAEVIPQRCVGCGNCVRVCSQNAKEVCSGIQAVEELLNADVRVAAMIAPSFPAALADSLEPQRFVGMLRALGFDWVHEVSFGADLVAREYTKLLEANDGKRRIATTCPAIVGYIERYHPELLDALTPIVSPMVATARVIRQLEGQGVKVVFIGPCIAKKGEMPTPDGEVDAVLTFVELWQMFRKHKISRDSVNEADFDPPFGGAGALFPIARGMLQAAGIREDLLAGDVVAAEGRTNFVTAINEFASGDLNAKLLEVLCCDGCIMGAGMGSGAPLFSRRSCVSQYVRQRREAFDVEQWQKDVERFASLDLMREFRPNDQRIPVPVQNELDMIMAKMGKFGPADELNCGACGYDTCREHAVAIFKGLAESEMCLPHTIEKLRETVGMLADSHQQLATTQEALMHSERLASMGQLAAGIAHEVNNPLGVVLMYSHLLLAEVQDNSLSEDLKMIAEQATRCKKIVSGLLDFARQNKLVLNDVNVPELLERSLHAVPVPSEISVSVEDRMDNPVAQMDADQISQVLTNLVSNAIAAMKDGGTITLTALDENDDEDRIRIKVADNGEGIAKENLSKIFEPFFTTKQMGKGTGLGLAVTYGIVKMHRGDIRVESNADPSAGPTGTTFTVTLPRRNPDQAPLT